MSNLIVRTRTVIQRSAKEIEPKLAVGLLTGSLTGAVLEFLAANHVVMSMSVQYGVVIAGFFIGGWIKSSTFPTEQEIETELPKAIAVADEVVKHPVKLVTSPIKVVAAVPNRFDNIINQLGTQPNSTADNAATQILPENR